MNKNKKKNKNKNRTKNKIKKNKNKSFIEDKVRNLMLFVFMTYEIVLKAYSWLRSSLLIVL